MQAESGNPTCNKAIKKHAMGRKASKKPRKLDRKLKKGAPSKERDRKWKEKVNGNCKTACYGKATTQND